MKANGLLAGLFLGCATLAGCSQHYLNVQEGPRASIRISLEDAVSGFIFADSEECNGRQFLEIADPDWIEAVVPGGKEITFGAITDLQSSGFVAVYISGTVVPTVSEGRMCRIIFTFVPESGETYTVQNPRLASNCEYSIIDSSGNEVDVHKRKPTGRAWSDASAWCENRSAGKGNSE